MKIAIIAAPFVGGGHIRGFAYRNYLQSKNHCVDMLLVDESLQSKIHLFYERTLAYFSGKEPRLMKKIAEQLERRIRKENYDVVIGVESLFSHVLTRNLNCLKLFSWESIFADEVYFEMSQKKTVDFERIHRIREMELEICRASDYVIFPWATTENYVRAYIYNGDNFVTLKYGCYPQIKTVSYFFPVSIVSMGNLKNYWSNKELVSYLTRISPYSIDVYGKYKPEKEYKLNYKGFAPSLEILRNYQFALNSVSKEIYRRNHHSSRILTYLSYGLPVLSPSWLKFSHDLKGVLPFNEDNFLDVLEDNLDPNKWEKISREAYDQAIELDWKKVLKPLEMMIEKG
jgi:hypothetical protein